MNRKLVVLLSIVALDAVGIGLIIPILPDLLKSVTGAADISLRYGVVMSVYAAMQFVFSPVLGALSDRFGRRPILLLSIAGATADYMVMALSPVFGVLLVGRAVAGLTSANMAVASAYITDITAEQDRAKGFGRLSAGFGIGFIIGPVLGGLLGSMNLRAPFALAALLNGANLLLVYFLLPESREPSDVALTAAALNPLAPLQRVYQLTAILPLLCIFTLFAIIGNIPGTVWVLYGTDAFHWSGLMVGLSLASFGFWHAGSQGLLTEPITRRFGEMRTVILGAVSDTIAFVLIALATKGWMAFVLSPLFALSGVAIPALQSMMSRQVTEDRQGELQGVLASLTSLTAIIGPLVGTSFYAYTRTRWVGAVWMLGAALYLLMVPLVIAARSAEVREQVTSTE